MKIISLQKRKKYSSKFKDRMSLIKLKNIYLKKVRNKKIL